LTFDGGDKTGLNRVHIASQDIVYIKKPESSHCHTNKYRYKKHFQQVINKSTSVNNDLSFPIT